jgi:hypothetical protein
MFFVVHTSMHVHVSRCTTVSSSARYLALVMLRQPGLRFITPSVLVLQHARLVYAPLALHGSK